MKHQLWATGLMFAMFGVEKGVSVDQSTVVESGEIMIWVEVKCL